MGKKTKIHFSQRGDIAKVEIRDNTYRVLYRKKFNIRDKNAIVDLLKAIEKFSGYSINLIIREMLKIDEWF